MVLHLFFLPERSFDNFSCKPLSVSLLLWMLINKQKFLKYSVPLFGGKIIFWPLIDDVMNGPLLDRTQDFKKVAKIVAPYTEIKEIYKNLKTNKNSNIFY